jgi:hypothetical protein
MTANPDPRRVDNFQFFIAKNAECYCKSSLSTAAVRSLCLSGTGGVTKSKFAVLKASNDQTSKAWRHGMQASVNHALWYACDAFGEFHLGPDQRLRVFRELQTPFNSIQAVDKVVVPTPLH